MDISTFAQMLRAIGEGKEPLVGFQLHGRGQLARIAEALGGFTGAAEYFDKVAEATDPVIDP